MNNNKDQKKNLSKEQREELLAALEVRFENNMNRHPGLGWEDVLARLETSPEKLWSLHQMEKKGGEPDVVGQVKKTGKILFFDCVPESPEERRALCYDREGLESRKANKPEGDAVSMAAAMGVELLTEEQYFELQELGEFDTKTSSWLKTPPGVRDLAGRSLGIDAMTGSLCTITAHNPITAVEDFAARSLCKFFIFFTFMSISSLKKCNFRDE